MTVKMITNIQQERYLWIKPILEKKLSYCEVLKTCPHSKRSLERWIAAFRKGGFEALASTSTKPKTQPNETPIRLKEEVIELRNKTGLCALKLHWRLSKSGINVPPRTIGKILKDEGLVRTYRRKKIKYKYIRAERQPGELVEIDVKYVPGRIEGKRYYQYTAIDTASRWRYLHIYEEQSTHHSICFLREIISRFPYTITAIKTDNHSTFTNYYLGVGKRSDMTVKTIHGLDRFCATQDIIHYLIDPGKPTQNGTVERSHREDNEKFYNKNSFTTPRQLKTKLRAWNEYYNNLEHCGLNGKTPNEMLQS